MHITYINSLCDKCNNKAICKHKDKTEKFVEDLKDQYSFENIKTGYPHLTLDINCRYFQSIAKERSDFFNVNKRNVLKERYAKED